MDSRDIKQEPRAITNGQYLEELFSLQKGLLDDYIKIEGLPQYPININTKKSQVLIKDFIGRVIEELAEGYESILSVKELTFTHKYWYNLGTAIGSSEERKGFELAISHLQNVSEEMVDALHFFLELLIYVNITPEDLKNWFIDQYTHKRGLKEYIEGVTKGKYDLNNTLDMLGFTFSILEKGQATSNSIHFIDLLDKYQVLHTHDEKGIDLRYLTMGSVVYTSGLSIDYPGMLWGITYVLNLARNCLKNKPWKQSGVITDENNFRAMVIEAFVAMMVLFRYMLREKPEWYDDLYWLYFKKNQVNHFRIKSKY